MPEKYSSIFFSPLFFLLSDGFFFPRVHKSTFGGNDDVESLEALLDALRGQGPAPDQGQEFGHFFGVFDERVEGANASNDSAIGAIEAIGAEQIDNKQGELRPVGLGRQGLGVLLVQLAQTGGQRKVDRVVAEKT